MVTPAAEFEYVDSKVNGTDILYYSNGKIRKAGNTK